MKPDFSARMLRLFLHARVAFHAYEASQAMPQARSEVFARLSELSGLSKTRIALAYGGHMNGAEPRAVLWAVLGHYPLDHGVVLDDSGGQADG